MEHRVTWRKQNSFEVNYSDSTIQTLILFKKLRLFSAFGNVSGFSYLTYVHYILDVSQILRDNHETTAIREATPKNDIQEHRNGKRTK